MNGPLAGLVRRHPWMAAAGRRHPDLIEIRRRTDDWSRRIGLGADDAARERLRRARFADIAARAFPETDPVSVGLFARWLVWLFALDDELDEGRAGRTVRGVDTLYDELRTAVRTGRARSPIGAALADLWWHTRTRAGTLWQCRFAAHLDLQWTGVRREAADRDGRRIPALDEYPELRRRAVGTLMMFDLVEPVLSVAVPSPVQETPEWGLLLDATNDVIAWCNDIGSLRKETAHGHAYNYVTVAAHTLGLTTEQASAWVVDRIVERLDDMRDAALRLPGVFERLGLPRRVAGEVSQVAVVLMGAPRGHLDWLLSCDRYAGHGVGRTPC